MHSFCALRRIAFSPNSFVPGLWDSELARGQDVSQQPGQALCTRVCSSLERFCSAGLTDSRSRRSDACNSMLAFYTNLAPIVSFEANAASWCNDELLFRHYRARHYGQLNAEWTDQVAHRSIQQ